MAKILIEISSDNAAFVEGAREEIARLVHSIAETLVHRPWIADGALFDANGNRAGQWCAEDLDPSEDADA